MRQNIVIIDAWTVVDCRNVSRWGREHVSKNIAVRFYITSSKKASGKQEDKKETTSRKFVNAWDGREKRSPR